MAREKAPGRSLARPTEPLYREIRAVLESARAGAYRAVNAAMVEAYWQVGRLIVEHEQGGRRRAAYGESVLEDLSRRLTADFGRGVHRHQPALHAAVLPGFPDSSRAA